MNDHQPVSIFLEMEAPETHRLMEFQTYGRGPALPYGGQWTGDRDYWERDATDANIFAEILRACPEVGFQGVPLPKCLGYTRIARAEIPQDRMFRDALVHDGTTLTFDLPKARAIHLMNLRRARETELGRLDREWMKATGQGKQLEADAIESQRQALRDAPQTLDLEKATTVEELKTIWPAELPRP